MAFVAIITETRVKTVTVLDADFDFEAERKVEERYLNDNIDMDTAEVVGWKIDVKEV